MSDQAHESAPEAGDPDLPTRDGLGPRLAALRPRLERMIAVRLDPRLIRRIDPEDVLQEVFLEVARRFDDYLERRPMPFFLWVRCEVGQKLVQLHRHHLGAVRRDARREVGDVPPASSLSMASLFVDPMPTPARSSAKTEALDRVCQALEGMEEVDREVLALRYFEQLTIEETATALGLSLSGAKKRHRRALHNLRAVLPSPQDLTTP